MQNSQDGVIEADFQKIQEATERVNLEILSEPDPRRKAQLERRKAKLIKKSRDLISEKNLNRAKWMEWTYEARAKQAAEVYARLRPKTPGEAGDPIVAAAEGVDVLGVAETTANPLLADHIVPAVEICFMDGFTLLTDERALAILNWHENLQALNKSSNSSRNDVPWTEWKGWRVLARGDADRLADLGRIVADIAAREDDLREKIAKMIAKSLAEQRVRGR